MTDREHFAALLAGAKIMSWTCLNKDHKHVTWTGDVATCDTCGLTSEMTARFARAVQAYERERAGGETGPATPEQMLREFHTEAGQVGGGFPSAELRQEMLDSEVQELREAVAAGDLVKTLDALADIVYVTVGTAVTMGLPFDAALREVHRSNMTKLIPPIRIREDGKILKGPHYEPPDIAGVLGLEQP